MAAKTSSRQPLEHYLALQYPFNAIASEDGGYVIVFPDLPGCITQVEAVEEIPAMAEDARRLWIETEYEDGADIPAPSYPEQYSGKFNVRIPRSLHRRLAESAEREGVSLNQYVTGLLEAGDAQARLSGEIRQELAALRGELHALHSASPYRLQDAPVLLPRRPLYAVRDVDYEVAS